MQAPLDAVGFIAELRARFPEVTSELDAMEFEGLLHPEVGLFEQVTLRAWAEGDAETVRQYLAFVNDAMAVARPDVLDALYVSYAEGFAWGSPSQQQARELMPKRLAAAFDEIYAASQNAP